MDALELPVEHRFQRPPLTFDFAHNPFATTSQDRHPCAFNSGVQHPNSLLREFSLEESVTDVDSCELDQYLLGNGPIKREDGGEQKPVSTWNNFSSCSYEVQSNSGVDKQRLGRSFDNCTEQVLNLSGSNQDGGNTECRTGKLNPSDVEVQPHSGLNTNAGSISVEPGTVGDAGKDVDSSSSQNYNSQFVRSPSRPDNSNKSDAFGNLNVKREFEFHSPDGHKSRNHVTPTPAETESHKPSREGVDITNNMEEDMEDVQTNYNNTSYRSEDTRIEELDYCNTIQEPYFAGLGYYAILSSDVQPFY